MPHDRGLRLGLDEVPTLFVDATEGPRDPRRRIRRAQGLADAIVVFVRRFSEHVRLTEQTSDFGPKHSYGIAVFEGPSHGWRLI